MGGLSTGGLVNLLQRVVKKVGELFGGLQAHAGADASAVGFEYEIGGDAGNVVLVHQVRFFVSIYHNGDKGLSGLEDLGVGVDIFLH